jgi:hypothetical protein
MERRKFIQLSAAAGVSGVAALGGSSCLVMNDGLRSHLETVTALPDMKDYLSRVDHGLGQIDEWRMAKAFQSEKIQDTGDWGAEDQLVRDSLKTLYLAGMFGDLPDAGQVHPGMQNRLWQNMDTMDQAIFGTADYLRNRTSKENTELKRVLAQRPNPGMKIAEELDNHALAIGLSLRRRFQTRNMFAQASFRLAHQDPATVYHEYITKIDKMAARAGSAEEIQRKVASRSSEKIFWANQQHLQALASQWELSGERLIYEVNAAAAKQRGSGTIRAGAMIMGIGVITGLVCLLIGETSGGVAVIGLTVGAILLVVGLITLIVGAIISAATS